MTFPPIPRLATRRRWCMAALAAPVAGLAEPARGRTLRVGPGERFRTLAQALRDAGDGDTLELQPGSYPGDVAVVEQSDLTIRGLGSGAVLSAEGRHAEGKAILVVRGSVAIQNLEFRGARVPSGNGAGIRFERGRLALRGCRFIDNENGVLTANEADMALDVEDCEFALAPRHEGLLHHLLYVGAIGRFSIAGSRFAQGWRGHLLKTRARHNLVRGNLLVDAPDGEASYELEFPNGSHNVVVGNVIVQSPLTQNAAIVSMGAEARGAADASLLMAHNTLVNLASDDAPFVRVWSDKLPPDTPLRLIDNLFAGPGRWLPPPGSDGGGNRHVGLPQLRDAARGDYRLATGSPWHGTALPLPANLRPPGAPAGPLSPGALQAAD